MVLESYELSLSVKLIANRKLIAQYIEAFKGGKYFWNMFIC